MALAGFSRRSRFARGSRPAPIWYICPTCGPPLPTFPSKAAMEEAAENHARLNGHEVRTSTGKRFGLTEEAR